MSLESLWPVTMGYLSECHMQGQHYMQLLVERVPLTSDRRANKLIHLCQRYNLKEQGEWGMGKEWSHFFSVSSLTNLGAPSSLLPLPSPPVKGICKVKAVKAYKNGRLGAALTWCIRGKVSKRKGGGVTVL